MKDCDIFALNIDLDSWVLLNLTNAICTTYLLFAFATSPVQIDCHLTSLKSRSSWLQNIQMIVSKMNFKCEVSMFVF